MNLVSSQYCVIDALKYEVQGLEGHHCDEHWDCTKKLLSIHFQYVLAYVRLQGRYLWTIWFLCRSVHLDLWVYVASASNGGSDEGTLWPKVLWSWFICILIPPILVSRPFEMGYTSTQSIFCLEYHFSTLIISSLLLLWKVEKKGGWFPF